MNNNIEMLLKNNSDFKKFLKLVKLGIISKKNACNAIVEEKDHEHILDFACEFNYNIVALEDAIIKTRKPDSIYRFACNVKGANILKLQDALIALGEPDSIYHFAKHFNKEANIPKLEDAAIAACIYRYGPENAYKFARDVKGANVKKLQAAIIEHGFANVIYYFAKDIEGADVLKLEDAIIEKCYTNEDYEYILRFARYVKGADISKLEDYIIKNKPADYILRFALNAPNADILKLEDAIIERGDLMCIYEFAVRIKGTDLSKLEDAIIKYDTLTGTYIECLMYEVKEANAFKLQESLKRLKQDKELKGINSKFKDNPNLLKLLTLLVNEEDDAILESKTTYTKLFRENKGMSRKLTKSQKS